MSPSRPIASAWRAASSTIGPVEPRRMSQPRTMTETDGGLGMKPTCLVRGLALRAGEHRVVVREIGDLLGRLDPGDLALLVDDDDDAVRDTSLFDEDAVL